MLREWDVVILGAGIAGLSCAQFLRRLGLRALVLERNAEWSEVGAGLQLAPNAQAALREINCLETLLHVGWTLREVELRSTRSGRLFLMKADGDGLLAVHRALLQRVLAQDLPTDMLRFGITIRSVAQDAQRVQLTLASGESLSCKLLIGADGIRSQVRSLIFPPVIYRYSGTSSYRGIVPASELLKNSQQGTEIWGPGCRLGFSQISARDVYWYLTFDAPAQESKAVNSRREHALQLMAHFPEHKALIELTPPDSIIHTDIGDIKPSRHWVEGRVALVGDAAHATTPNLGQGAAQALEDAWALRLALESFGLEPRALLAYQAARQEKALWIVRQSWSFQSVCHLKAGWRQSLRDFVVKHMPASYQEANLKKIYTPAVSTKANANFS